MVHTHPLLAPHTYKKLECFLGPFRMAGSAAMMARASWLAMRAVHHISTPAPPAVLKGHRQLSSVGAGGIHDVGGDPLALGDPISTTASADMQAWELSCHSVSLAQAPVVDMHTHALVLSACAFAFMALWHTTSLSCFSHSSCTTTTAHPRSSLPCWPQRGL